MTCDMPLSDAVAVLNDAGFATWALAEPQYFHFPSSWVGHIPFALWLIPTLRPRLVVELGTHDGNAYMSMCQAIAQHRLPANAFAIDKRIEQRAGDCEEFERFRRLKQSHDPLFGGFSELLRTRVDETIHRFDDGTIDLLHVDDLSSYESARAIFDAWLPKLSTRAVVLIHDVNVVESEFGMDRFWEELAQRYSSFKFSHCNGLGVLLVGEEQVLPLLALSSRAACDGHWVRARQFFQVVGNRLETRADFQTLSRKAAHASLTVDRLQSDAQRSGLRIRKLEAKLYKRDALIAELRDLVGQSLDHFRQPDAAAVQALAEIRASRSWRLTAPYRAVGVTLRRLKSALRTLLARTASNGDRSRMGPIAPLPDATAGCETAVLTPELRSAIVCTGKLLTTRRVGIMTPRHTAYVARALRRALVHVGIHAEVSIGMPPGSFDKDLYFVLCPQTFERLPPGGKRICIQMEQSVSSRWFTPQYIELLAASLSVFDYSTENLAYLHEKGIRYPTTFFMPIGGIAAPGNIVAAEGDSPTPEHGELVDVFFYGDIQNERRRELLAKIGEHFTTRVVSDLFGEALEAEIRRARVVINLHYYENALLETTRIYECLSLGACVVSEVGSDQPEHHMLRDAVTFVPVGDIDALLAAIRHCLDEAPALRRARIQKVVLASEMRFNFMLYRALRALNIITNTQFDKLIQALPLPGEKVALSLPETSSRHAWFKSNKPDDVALFEGVRAAPGWIGCGLSYRYLARKAIGEGADQLLICEDDVELDIDFEQRMTAVTRFLKKRARRWDIFAGLIADLHSDVQILDVEDFEGVTFVTVDKMTSMVYNIYARRALELIARWDPENFDLATNTIDRYLENTATLRTVTTLPFVAGHRASADSSLWGISNQSYVAMIARSQRLLAGKVWEFRAERATSALSPQAACVEV